MELVVCDVDVVLEEVALLDVEVVTVLGRFFGLFC